MSVIEEFVTNVTVIDHFTYSFLSDDFIDSWRKKAKPLSELSFAIKHFLDNYIRNIDGRAWGFIVYRDVLEGENMYSVSLRSVGGVKDVSLIAVKLNGGGHRPAAGGKVRASNVQEAVSKVNEAIEQAV